MPLWAVPPTYTTSQVPTATDLNNAFRDNSTALARRPLVNAWCFGAFPGIPNNAFTTVPFNAVNQSVTLGFNTATAEINWAGGGTFKLWISATLFWTANGTGMRGLRIWDNASSTELGGGMIDTVPAGTYTEQSWSGFINTTGSSRIVVQAYQSSGATLTLQGGQTGRTQVTAVGVYWN